MTAQQILVIATVGYVITSVVALIYLRSQIRQAAQTRVEDHARRKKQATVERYARLSADQQVLRDEIIRRCGGIRAPDENLSGLIAQASTPKLGEEPELFDPSWHYQTRVLLREHLNGWESLACGVRMHVYDFDVISNIARARLLNNWTDFQQYILLRRKSEGTTSVYEHFEWLALRLGGRATVDAPVDGALPEEDQSSSSSNIQVPSKKRRRRST